MPAGDLVEELRAVKDEDEIERIAAAAELTDEVYRWAIERGLAGRTEREVARACEARIRELGRRAVVPADRRGRPERRAPARRAGRARDRQGGAGRLRHGRRAGRLLLGLHPHLRHRRARRRGARGLRAGPRGAGGGAGGGPAGALGPRGRRRRARADRGRAATASASATASATASGSRCTRRPRLAASSEDELRAGNVVTVEPGVYLPGQLGVRIEDLVVVGEDGHRNLSGLDKGSRSSARRGRRLLPILSFGSKNRRCVPI